MPGVQSAQRCFLLALRGHVLDGKRLAWNPTVAEMSTRNFVLGQTLFVASWRLEQARVLQPIPEYTRGPNECCSILLISKQVLDCLRSPAIEPYAFDVLSVDGEDLHQKR